MMMMTADLKLWFSAAAIVVGCGGAASSSSVAPDAMTPPICDGSANLRLRIFVEPQNGRELRGSIVRVENGYQSLMIDGACDFWIGGGWIDDPMARDLGWRRGHIPAALEQELETLISIGDLGSVQDCLSNDIADAPTRSIRSATSRARCIRGGPRFEAAWSWAEKHGPDLWHEGVPLDQGIRVEAVMLYDGDNSKAYGWPAGAPLAELILQETEGSALVFASGVSTLVMDPDRAQALRRLRDEYIADRRAFPGLFYDGQKMTDEQHTSAVVYMRDQLPYEDERGLLPFSDPANPPTP